MAQRQLIITKTRQQQKLRYWILDRLPDHDIPGSGELTFSGRPVVGNVMVNSEDIQFRCDVPHEIPITLHAMEVPQE